MGNPLIACKTNCRLDSIAAKGMDEASFAVTGACISKDIDHEKEADFRSIIFTASGITGIFRNGFRFASLKNLV